MEVILNLSDRMPVYHPAFPRILEACWAVTQLAAPSEDSFLKVLIGGNEDWLHVYATAKSGDPISSFAAAQAILDRARQTKLHTLIRIEPKAEAYTDFESDNKGYEAFCRFSMGTDKGPIQYSDPCHDMQLSYIPKLPTQIKPQGEINEQQSKHS